MVQGGCRQSVAESYGALGDVPGETLCAAPLAQAREVQLAGRPRGRMTGQGLFGGRSRFLDRTGDADAPLLRRAPGVKCGTGHSMRESEGRAQRHGIDGERH